MTTKTFIAKLKVRIGEYENLVTLLLVANSSDAASDLLERAAAGYYGNGDEPLQEGGYYANHGEVHVSAQGLQEIGLANFLELKTMLTVQVDANVHMPEEKHLDDGLQKASASLHSALKLRAPEIRRNDVLNALAASWGHKHWQNFKAKFTQPQLPAALVQPLVDAVEAISMSSFDDGCSENLNVVDKRAVSLAESALKALAAHGIKPEPVVLFDQDTVDDLVEDVQDRAKKYGFSLSNPRQMREALVTSAELLDLSPSEEELKQALMALGH